EPNKEFFDDISNPIEYHYIASIYNWDDGPKVLSWIINSSLCDKGTAKLIFWRSQPDYYTRFLNKEDAEWDGEVFQLVKTIIDNFQSDFYKTENIFYDPRQDPATDVDSLDSKAKWAIPE